MPPIKQYTLTENYDMEMPTGAVIIAGICDECLAGSVIAPEVVIKNNKPVVIGWSIIDGDLYRKPAELRKPPHHPEDGHRGAGMPSFLRRKH